MTALRPSYDIVATLFVESDKPWHLAHLSSPPPYRPPDKTLTTGAHVASG